MTAPRRRSALLLALIVAAGAAVRFYNLGWGAPYFHFHIDEHFVFVGAVQLRTNFLEAAGSPKFFIYSPLPMYLTIGVTELYEAIAGTLDLASKEGGIRFMVLGRAISAAFGTATIPLVYLIARQAGSPAAGLLAALLMAAGVLHIRESHFLSVDVTLTFFSVLAWFCMMRMVRDGRLRDYVTAGVAIGLAVLCKYSAAFLIPVVGVAHLLAPGRPAWGAGAGPWMRWLGRGTLPGFVAVATFLVLDPLVLLEFDKFQSDVRAYITDPMSGSTTHIWAAHFTGIRPRLYWFTNLLWWGLGPAFEIWAIAGAGWLLWRRDRLSLMAAAFPILYFLIAGRTMTPFARYAVPLVPALAVAAGILGADAIRLARGRGPAAGRLAAAAVWVVAGSTLLYAAAYMNVFIDPDARLTASRFLLRRVPENSRVLVEPSHNIPPTGSYLTAPNFYHDYVLWGRNAERHDYYHLFALDTYRYLYDSRPSPEEKRQYIEERLALVDYIVMDDTFLQFYDHLPTDEHGVVKQYYEDLFAGRLGFELMRSFKVYPALGRAEINDDAAELSFRLFDHPRVFVFRRAFPADRPAGPPSGGGATAGSSRSGR